jgi:hypothetical protein
MAVNWGASDIVLGIKLAWEVYQIGFKEENAAGMRALMHTPVHGARSDVWFLQRYSVQEFPERYT